MIDPKLNEIPANTRSAVADDVLDETNLTEEQRSELLRRRRQGLSINDTVAANSNMTVGSKGVDTSGVEAGAGAGAGITNLTPGTAEESPNPKVVSGTRGTGMTPRGDTDFK